MAKTKIVSRDINLLPLEYREKEKFNIIRILTTVFIIALFAASGYLYFHLENEIFTRENEINSLEAQLAIIEKGIEEVKNLERDREELASRVAMIENLIKNQSSLTRVLGDFSATVLPEVWLNNLSVSANQTFNFTANTFNNYLIAHYMNTLKDHNRFDAIELQFINKQSTQIPEQDREIDTVNFQLSGIFIPYHFDYYSDDK
jgi:type IV pilus assembly protein PilN